MPMKTMGALNKNWGVCGFTSTFYAMYELNRYRVDRAQIINAGRAFRLLAEIKTYLRTLQTEGKTLVLSEIEMFNQKFGDSAGDADAVWRSKFTIDEYIKLISSAVTQTDNEIKGNERLGLALPPEAVADYLRRIWEHDSTVTNVFGKSDAGGDGIIGVTSGDPKMTLYDGLEHWMFRFRGKIYSWGMVFDSVAEAAKTASTQWSVCYFIGIKSNVA